MPRNLLALLVALPLAAHASQVSVPPKPSHYVTDGSGVLDPGRARALNEKLADFERKTSTQVLVWIAPRVPEGTTMEVLGAEAIRAWGVGQKNKDNGLVFFLFTEDRTTRIATGYGLEGPIPDVVAKRILVDVVRPYLRQGDYTGGVEAGVDAILRAASGEGYAGSGRTVAEGARNQGRPSLGWKWILIPLVIPLGWFPWILIPLVILFGWIRRSRGIGSGADDSGFSSDLDSSSNFGSSLSGSSSSNSASSFDSGGGDSGGGGASDRY